MTVDYNDAVAWVSAPPTRAKRVQYACLRMLHHVLPRIFDAPLSITGIFSIIFQMVSIIGIVTAPYWIALFTDNKIPSATAFLSAIVIVFLKLVGWIAPKIKLLSKEEDQKRKHLDELAIRHFNIVKELFSVLSEDAMQANAEWRMRQSDKILSCILHLANYTISNGRKDDLQCTLLLFDDDKGQRLKIAARAKDNRPTGSPVQADQTIAYYVAMSGRVFVVNDLKAQDIFPKSGLSRPKAPYRSILLIPIIVHAGNEKECVGLVTIDSPRPSEFWGDLGDVLATQLIPFVHIFTLIMSRGYHKVAIKEV